MRINAKQFSIVVFVIIFLLQIFVLFSSASINTIKLYPIADTYIDAYDPDRNFGDADRFEVKEEYYNSYNNTHGGANAYLKFDASNITDGVTIVNADLSVYLWMMQGGQNNCSVSVHYCSDNFWNEELITWNNAPNFEQQAINTNNLIAFDDKRYSWDVTDVIADILVNNKLSLVLKAIDVPASSLKFWSKEYSQAEAPILYINYTYEQPNISPTADFSYSLSNPTIDDTIQFTDTSSDSDGTIASWSWNFGDGTSSISKNPIHKYISSGTYTVSLQVTDNDSATNTKIITIPVSSGTNNKGTPGFELVFVIGAIALFLWTRKRKE